MISHRRCRTLLALSLTFRLTSLLASANTSVHTSWMWHMHQPIYWPDRASTGHIGDHYQNAYDSMDRFAAALLRFAPKLPGEFAKERSKAGILCVN